MSPDANLRTKIFVEQACRVKASFCVKLKILFAVLYILQLHRPPFKNAGKFSGGFILMADRILMV
ncbi:MAG: hypothetical protein BGN92_05690 [Sphingobacteriales bacterium 41-5]|nr:MAG: hypothetical protein BGN92_05690 [Sphingobacteriales bacterium 41-5]